MDSRYASNAQALDRLVREWREYGKIIIAYDFDDTVYDYHRKGDTFERVMNLLRDCKEYAHFVVFTACGEDEYPKIIKYLSDNDVPFDKINENADIVNFKGRKIYYNIFLDDRAGLSAAMYTLRMALEVIKKGRR